MRLTANELLMLVALLIVVLGTWGFITLASTVMAGGTQEFDKWAVHSFRHMIDSHAPFTAETVKQSFLDISALGGPTVLLLMTSAIIIFLLWDRRYNAMLLVTMATVGGVILAFLLKEAIGRPRPNVEQLAAVTMSSFPSGHSMLSAIVYPTLGTLLARIVSRKRLKIYFMLVGADTQRPDRHQPCLSRGALSHGRAGGLGCRAGLGGTVLDGHQVPPAPRSGRRRRRGRSSGGLVAGAKPPPCGPVMHLWVLLADCLPVNGLETIWPTFPCCRSCPARRIRPRYGRPWQRL